MLRYDLCDFSDAHIVVKGDINVTKKMFTADDFERPHNTNLKAINTNNAKNNVFGEKKLVSKNNAPFINCISKINYNVNKEIRIKTSMLRSDSNADIVVKGNITLQNQVMQKINK